ncbi:tetratricopeptide repeat protein [Archangium violaceum]|uniref:CHAT domain-containing tetratricopeptide repeat protein n=1 Tax=Archangium violaceum TaxID=83451 RepID=UPI00195152F3|nr:tetratricopeptide repeat protein [Archangium violaceum]QRO00167.1 tetratricopeptide repeat protein [Archangium violaceum]
MAVLCCVAGAALGQQRTNTLLEEARTAFEEGVRLEDAGRHAEAVPLFERALALREAELGGTHPDVATSLDILANLYAHLGFYARAEPLHERALAIRESALGEDHPDVASSLSHLARLYQFQGRYGRARPLHERALAIRESALGKDHPDVAASLNSLATLHQLQGRYGQAEALYARALAIHEAALGKNHLLVAYSLSNLAFLSQDKGLYAQAEALYVRALAVYEAALGENHPKVADALLNLAQLYDEQGLYGRSEPLYARAILLFEATLDKPPSKAAYLLINVGGQIEPLYERALAISEESALGKTHPHIAVPFNNLAFLYNQAIFHRWETLHERGIALYEEAFGRNHPEVADLLVKLAALYQDMGLYDRAEPRLQRALTIYEATCGKNHLRVAATLKNLASSYRKRGLYTRAEPLLQRALAIYEAALGKNHPDIAWPLTELASVYRNEGRYKRAEPLLQRALATQEAALGRTHPDVALTLYDLASVHQRQGHYNRAARLFQRALAIQEAALGRTHPDVALTLNTFAQLRLAQNRLDEALPLFTRAFDISERLLRQQALDFSESHLADFLQFIRTDEERLYSLARAYPDDARVRRLALAAVLLRKGRSVEETAGTSRAVYHSLGAQDLDTFERLRDLRTQFARLSLEGPGRLAPADYLRRLKELTVQGDALESDLASRSAPLRTLSELPSPDEIVDRVAATLPPDGALVELVLYTERPLIPSSEVTEQSRRPGTLRYLALVLLPDGSCHVVDLGPAAPIDLAASRFRDGLADRDAAYLGLSRELHSLAFRPLLPLPGGARRLFLSPDGQLGLVPFAALHDGNHFLIDTFDFTYLTSGKDLLTRPPQGVEPRSVVVFADPDFGTPPATPPPSQEESATWGSALERFFSTRGTDLAERPWVPLPGTRQEAKALQHLIPQARLFLGGDATKGRLLQLPAPRILHIATHGFFLEDASVPAGSRALVQLGTPGKEGPGQYPPDPLLRSGLVLAGARSPATKPGEDTQLRLEDSLVTALELAGLDLWGTELVVLSACDTGRGDVKPGQGVYGLRRAFVIAGAETVVMSLWKVNDDTTRVLMEGYYRNLLAGQGRSFALREAMLALRRSHPHPSFWAPFIVLGRDAPLRALTR